MIAHLGMKRDEATHEPYLYYANIPASVAERPVLLVDPMLATGGSLVAAIQAVREPRREGYHVRGHRGCS